MKFRQMKQLRNSTTAVQAATEEVLLVARTLDMARQTFESIQASGAHWSDSGRQWSGSKTHSCGLISQRQGSAGATRTTTSGKGFSKTLSNFTIHKFTSSQVC